MDRHSHSAEEAGNFTADGTGSPWRKIVFKVYSIMDIFSRQIVGWRAEEREADHLAVEMFETAIAHHGAPQVAPTSAMTIPYQSQAFAP